MFVEDDKDYINFGNRSDLKNRWEQYKANIYREFSFRKFGCKCFRDKKWKATKGFSKALLHLAQVYSHRLEEYLRRRSSAACKTDGVITEIYKNVACSL